MAAYSLFRVGTNVELWRVSVMLVALVIGVIILEHILHFVEKKIGPNRTYHEMLQKIYKELMIFGLVGLGVKLLKEFVTIESDNNHYIAFQVADYMMFVMALGLVLQALGAYVWFYQKNKQMDFDEVFVAQDLIELLEMNESYKGALNNLPYHQRILARTRNFIARKLSLAKEDDYSSKRLMHLVHTRTLRHFFLVKYGLPYSFPFAKYLKKAQEAQINMMLEVKLSVWVVVFWGLTVWELMVEFWAKVANKGEAKAIFYTYTLFVWLLLLVQLAVAVFLEKAIFKTANSSGHATTIEAINWLKELAAFEKAHQVSCKHFKTIIRIMLQVEREQERKKYNAESTAPKFSKWRPACLKKKFEHAAAHETSVSPSQNNPSESLGTTLELDMSNCPGGVKKGVEIPIKFFNPVVMEDFVRLLIMINAFFAIMFNAILYQMNEASLIPLHILVPLPVFLNMIYLQPRIFQRLVLLSSIANIQMAAFLEVNTEFIKIIEGRAEFIQKLYTNLALSGKTISQLQMAFAEKESSNSGHISLENFWSIMTECGIEYSALRFKSMIEKLFLVLNNEFRYTQIFRLLSLFETAQSCGTTNSVPEKSLNASLRRSAILDDIMDEFKTNAISLDEETRSLRSSLARKRSQMSMLQIRNNWSSTNSHPSDARISSREPSPSSFIGLSTDGNWGITKV